MDRKRGLELQRRSLAEFLRLLAARSEGGALVERDRVLAAVLPATPERSVMNSVVYEDAAALGAALDELERAYDAAGVRAWTVWVPDFDAEAIERLRAAGHRFDAEPAAMSMELAELAPPDPAGLDWDAAADPGVLGRINSLAYGFGVDDFSRAIGGAAAEPPLRLYQARVEGEPVSVAATLDSGGDCSVYFVATLKAHRGHGLSRRLLHAALAEARERGLETSTLQATGMGYPIYERLGYRSQFRLHMYERRRATPS